MAAEEDRPGQRVHALLAVQARQHPEAKHGVIDVGEQVTGLGHAAEFLDRLLERVLAPQALERFLYRGD